jgi:uncharacterized protein (DUF433 family)
MILENQYIEYRDGGYWIKDKRVSLDSLVYQWREGLSPETIRESYPVLTLKEVYGAISFYLDHQAEIDEYLRQAAQEEEVMAENIRATYPDIHLRMDALLKSKQLVSK